MIARADTCLGGMVDDFLLRMGAVSERFHQEKPTLRGFIREAWPLLNPGTRLAEGFYIDAVSDHLEAILTGDIRFLIINIPPRFAKSTIASVCWPAYSWTVNPSLRWLTASYADKLAVRDSVNSRRLIMSNWFQHRWGHLFQMTGDQNVKGRYENDQTGWRIATSVNGTATGDGGNIVMVDDPHNVVEAHSEIKRQGTIEWWDQSMFSRMNNPMTDAMVVIMQRVHAQDLVGHLLETSKEYVHLSLPMEYEPTTYVSPLGWRDPRRRDGQLLAPERFGPDEVKRAKVRLGEAGYAGQYQQRPAPAEGGVIKRRWLKFWQPAGMHLPPVSFRLANGEMFSASVFDLPALDEQAQSWDMAFGDGATNSYVVGQAWGRAGANAYLLNQFRDHVDIVGTISALKGLTLLHPLAVKKLIENKANGPAVISTLKSSVPGLIPIEPVGGKYARLVAVSPMIEAGNVFFPHPALFPWVDALIQEVIEFPNARDSDQVDALSQALDQWKAGEVAPAVAPGGGVRPSAFAGVGAYADDE